MNLLAFAFALQLGMFPQDSFILYDPPPMILSENSFYTDLSAEVRLFDNHLFIGGFTRTYVWPLASDNWWPFRHDYAVNAGLRFSFIEVGVKRVCLHPSTQYRLLISPRLEGAYTEIYLKFSGKIE